MDELRLHDLLEKDLEGRLTESETDELFRELRSSPQARRHYWDVLDQHVLTGAILSENRGRDLANLETDDPARIAEPATTTRRSRTWAFKLTVFAAVSCLLLAAGWWLRPTYPAPLATILAVTGNVEIGDALGRSFTAETGSVLFVGQVLRVGDEESRAELLFTDGTQVALQSGSTLRFSPSDSRDGKRIHLENGAVQVQTVAETSVGPLVVTTDHAKITSSSTRLRVYREEKGSRVELEEGKAHLESPNGAKAIDVAEGSFVFASADQTPMVSQPLAESQCRLRHTFLRAGDAVAFSRDGSRIVTSHFARSGLKAWNTIDGSVVATAPGSRQRTHGMAFAADGTVVAICADGTAVLWKIGDPQPQLTRLRDKELRPAAVSQDGRWIAQLTRAEVAIWEVDADKASISHRHSFETRPSRVALSNVGPQVAVSKWGGEILRSDAIAGTELSSHKLSPTPAPLALSADNRYLSAYTAKEGLVLFDEHAKTRKTLWAGQGVRVSHLNFTSDSKIVLAGMDDGTVRAWSADDGRSILVLETGHRHVNMVTMSTDRSLLATVGDNDCVKIWECTLP